MINKNAQFQPQKLTKFTLVSGASIYINPLQIIAVTRDDSVEPWVKGRTAIRLSDGSIYVVLGNIEEIIRRIEDNEQRS